MKDNLEHVLADTLLTHESTAKMAASIVERLKNNNHKNVDRKPLIQFLIHAGYIKDALSLYVQWFENAESEIPLHEYVHLLKISKTVPNKDFFKHLEQAQNLASEKNRIHYCENWDNASLLLQKAQNAWMNDAKRQSKEKYEQWLTQIQYLQSQRMLNEEERLLNRLSTIYPDDEYIKQQIIDLKDRKAINTIYENTETNENKDLKKHSQRFSQSEIEIANILLEQMKDICSRASVKDNTMGWAYDFAIGFYFMGLYEYALEILSLAPSSIATDWLYPELLIQSERYIECLDCLENIEVKYADDPETTFAVTYYRSLSLHGVGQISMACNLLKSLVNVRPHYRSSHEFLLKWAGIR